MEKKKLNYKIIFFLVIIYHFNEHIYSNEYWNKTSGKAMKKIQRNFVGVGGLNPEHPPPEYGHTPGIRDFHHRRLAALPIAIPVFRF